jgi:hypothetical protein
MSGIFLALFVAILITVIVVFWWFSKRTEKGEKTVLSQVAPMVPGPRSFIREAMEVTSDNVSQEKLREVSRKLEAEKQKPMNVFDRFYITGLEDIIGMEMAAIPLHQQRVFGRWRPPPEIEKDTALEITGFMSCNDGAYNWRPTFNHTQYGFHANTVHIAPDVQYDFHEDMAHAALAAAHFADRGRDEPDNQNVHDPSVVKSFAKIFEKVAKPGDDEEAENEDLDEIFAHACPKMSPETKRLAIKSRSDLFHPDRLGARISSIGGGKTLGEILGSVVKRISATTDPELKRSLETSLVENLASAQEHGMPVCAQGFASRILNTFVGVDETVNSPLTSEMTLELAKTKASHFLTTAIEADPEMKKISNGDGNQDDPAWGTFLTTKKTELAQLHPKEFPMISQKQAEDLAEEYTAAIR